MSETPKPSTETDSTSTTPLKSIAAGRVSKKTLLHHDDHEHNHAPAHQSTGRISKTLVNFWLDGLLGVVFVKLCVIAVIVQFVFPPGIAARGVTLWGMNYGQWCSIQFAVLAFLGLGILLHVMLHWTWVCSVLTKRVLGKNDVPDDGIRTLYGVGLLIALLLTAAVTVGIAQWMIVIPE